MGRKNRRVGAILPWFGGKRGMADRIVEVLGEHRSYWEPFCGSMAVLLAKPESTFEAVNDLHGDLTNLARVVRDDDSSSRLYWRLLRTLPVEGVFRDSLAALRLGPAPGPDADLEVRVDRAYHYFVNSWLGVNGVAGSKRKGSSYARRYTSGGGDPGVRFVSAVDSLPWWHARLRSVLVYSSCGIEMCERIEDRAGTAIYADPPYLEKSAEYQHDFSGGDHRRLAAALSRFEKTRVVVSYYDHPQLDDLYPGWQKVAVSVTKAMCNGVKRARGGRIDAPEVLLVRN